MGLLKGLKSFFLNTEYRINRDVLVEYVRDEIEFCKKENLDFCDEFFLFPNEASEKLHIVIINFDVPCEYSLQAEEGLKGIIIFECMGKHYNPEIDKKYYTIEDFISCRMADYPQWFIMTNAYVAPVALEKYKI